MLKVMEKNMYFHRYERNLKIIESIAQKAIKQRRLKTPFNFFKIKYWK